MALTYTTDIIQYEGNKKVARGLVTFDSSYPTGGEAFSLAGIGLSRLDDLKLESDDGVLLEWDRSLTSPKIKAYRNVGTFTDSSGGTAGTSLAAGVGKAIVPLPCPPLADLSTAAIDILTTYTPGFKFKLLSFAFATTVAGTGASASQVFNLEIGTTNVTGGALTLLLADTDTIGKIKAATAITAANTGSSTDTISIEMAASGTVFTAGEGFFLLGIQNMDTADAFATLLTAGDEVADTVSLSGVTARFEAIGA